MQLSALFCRTGCKDSQKLGTDDELPMSFAMLQPWYRQRRYPLQLNPLSSNPNTSYFWRRRSLPLRLGCGANLKFGSDCMVLIDC